MFIHENYDLTRPPIYGYIRGLIGESMNIRTSNVNMMAKCRGAFDGAVWLRDVIIPHPVGGGMCIK